MAFEDVIKTIGISKDDIVDYRSAKYISGSGEDSINYAGYLILTKDKLIFASEKGLFKAPRIMYEVTLEQIKKVTRIRLVNQLMVFANTAKEGAGFFKRMFSAKTGQFSLKDAEPFASKIKEMNPHIKT